MFRRPVIHQSEEKSLSQKDTPKRSERNGREERSCRRERGKQQSQMNTLTREGKEHVLKRREVGCASKNILSFHQKQGER